MSGPMADDTMSPKGPSNPEVAPVEEEKTALSCVQVLTQPIHKRQYELVVSPDININEVYTGEIVELKSFETQEPPFYSKNPYLAPVVINRKLNSAGDVHFMHLELDISGSDISYDSGDHVAVFPINDASMVNRIGQLLDVDLDTIISLNNVDKESPFRENPFPCPTTYRTALTHYVDINNPPRIKVLSALAQYATDSKDKESLLKMASTSPDGRDLYQSWVVDAKRNILAVLEDMPSVRPALDHLCELLPRLDFRYYSIASSGKVYPTTISICAVVVVVFGTNTVRTFKGVTTNWLKNKVAMATVPMFVRYTQYKLPTQASDPVVMIGTGTGIAPFMGFLQERSWLKQQGKEVGETILYFGCCHRNEDFLYQQELEEFEKAGVLTQLHVAFSRDQEHKVYVQHLMKKNQEHLWKLIHTDNAHIYICGGARGMAGDVLKAFHEIAEEMGSMTDIQAKTYIKMLVTNGRYSLDIH